MVVKVMNSGSDCQGLNVLASLCISSLICKMRIIIVPTS